MARQPRIVIPGQAMHIVQRGNNRQATFYANEDYRTYLDMHFYYLDQRAVSWSEARTPTTTAGDTKDSRKQYMAQFTGLLNGRRNETSENTSNIGHVGVRTLTPSYD